MLLEAYLKEVKQRADAATPGPWNIHVGHDRFSSNPGPYGAYMEFGNNCIVLVSSLSEKTTSFIAHSREDIPKLLSVIERMREAIEEFRLGHEHQPDLPHTRAMGGTYGWCDFCQTKVVWGKGYADSCISDCDKIAGGEK